jgi:8-amino-7-oxononanoate synthase
MPILERLNTQHALRQLETLIPYPTLNASPSIQDVEGNRLLQFSSNDYLGFSQHPILMEAGIQALQKWGTGGSSSRLVVGEHPLYQGLEQALAQWKKTEAALVFPTGLQTNSAALPALLTSQAIVLADKLNHASLVDGIRLSGAKAYRYRHLDFEDLESRLQWLRTKHPTAPIWLVSDTLFSMDGDALDVAHWCDIAERYNCFTYADEAHATGIFGATRSGLVEAADCGHRINVQMGTFSKAMGSLGGYIACSRLLADVLINRARGLVYTTALPPAVLATNVAAIEQLQQDTTATTALWRNIHFLQETLEQYPALRAIQLPPSQSQIFSFLLGENDHALKVATHLRGEGFMVKAIRPPTVPVGQARLRISLQAQHQPKDITSLLDTLAQTL